MVEPQKQSSASVARKTFSMEAGMVFLRAHQMAHPRPSNRSILNDCFQVFL